MTCRFLVASAQFFFMLIGLRESVTAINCFSCNYSSTTIEVTSSCSDSPSSASGDINCSGTLCHTVWAEYSTPSNTYRIQECTNSSSDTPPIEGCQGTTINNKTYFVYQNQCCSSTGHIINYGTMYRIIECYCQTNYCNGVTILPITTAGDTTVSNSPSSNQPVGYSTLTGQSLNTAASKDNGNIYSTRVDHEIVTTSRAVWQRNTGNTIFFSTTLWISFILTTMIAVTKGQQ